MQFRPQEASWQPSQEWAGVPPLLNVPLLHNDVLPAMSPHSVSFALFRDCHYFKAISVLLFLLRFYIYSDTSL